MTDEIKKDLLDTFSTLGQAMEEIAKEYEKECDTYWKGLSKEDQLKAFYSVVKRIHKGEVEDQGSYRWVLYDVFGFGPEAYSIGMECGFLELHNMLNIPPKSTLYKPEEIE